MAVITLTSLYIFTAILEWGAIGAGLAMFLGFGASQVFIIWPFGLKMVHGRWSVFLRQGLLPGLLPVLMALLACWMFGQVQPVQSWITLGAGCAVSAIVYLAVMLACCRDPKDKELIKSAIRKIRRSKA